MNEMQNNRRDFFKETGKRALWAAPTATLLMTAASQPALATNKGSGTQYKFTGSGKSSKKAEKKFKFFGSGGKSSKSSKKK